MGHSVCKINPIVSTLEGWNENKLHLWKIGLHGWTGSWLDCVASFGTCITGTESSGSATKELISKMGLREIDCEDRTGSWSQPVVGFDSNNHETLGYPVRELADVANIVK